MLHDHLGLGAFDVRGSVFNVSSPICNRPVVSVRASSPTLMRSTLVNLASMRIVTVLVFAQDIVVKLDHERLQDRFQMSIERLARQLHSEQVFGSGAVEEDADELGRESVEHGEGHLEEVAIAR